ncbi:membrane protein [Leptolyngbya sp. KIOST-1]|uniref:membrane protein n=1 Tax=Leptolyngbya sp. KIOST-1 TaxID=1229172 RepID=UPI00055B5C61|nr:membrane protein [Leptolyngbya sp. KIOST-1]
MVNRVRRQIRRFFRQARTVNNEPVNRASLAVIILIDLFILFNVFSGLSDISRWPLSPYQAHPCHEPWAGYRNQTQGNRDYDILRASIQFENQPEFSWANNYRNMAEGHLGEVSPICLDYAATADGLDTPNNRQILAALDQVQDSIADLEQENQTIRSQYDSTLLEQIAGQSPEQSINQVEAAQARATLDRNNASLEQLRQQERDLQTQLTQTPASQPFLALLNNDAQFQSLDRQYQRASFWYPTVQLLFQSLFLLPLVGLAWAVYRFAERRGYGLVALQSWHLLVIFCIPLVIKVFEVLQFGALFSWLSQVIVALLGGLLFLINYLYILVVPLIGYSIIKFFQKVVLNPRLQVAGRVQNQKCIRCAKKLRRDDAHCPHCGYHQETECHHCHQPTYKYLPYCRHCGTPQELEV